MPIRIDEDVHKMIHAIKEGVGASNVSDALRVAIKKAYPNIEEIVAAADRKDVERQRLLESLLKTGNS